MKEAYVRKHMARCVPYIIPYGEDTEEKVIKLLIDAGLRPLAWEDPVRIGGATSLVMLSFARLKVVIEQDASWAGFAKIYADKRLNGKLRRRVVVALMSKEPSLKKLVNVKMDGQTVRLIAEMWAEWKMMREATFKEYYRYVRSNKWSDARWRAMRKIVSPFQKSRL